MPQAKPRQGSRPKSRKWRLGDPYQEQKSEGLLVGIPAIATYLGKSYETVRRWIVDYQWLPASKDLQGRWFTSKSLIDQWIVAGWRAELNAKGRPDLTADRDQNDKESG